MKNKEEILKMEKIAAIKNRFNIKLVRPGLGLDYFN